MPVSYVVVLPTAAPVPADDVAPEGSAAVPEVELPAAESGAAGCIGSVAGDGAAVGSAPAAGWVGAWVVLLGVWVDCVST